MCHVPEWPPASAASPGPGRCPWPSCWPECVSGRCPSSSACAPPCPAPVWGWPLARSLVLLIISIFCLKLLLMLFADDPPNLSLILATCGANVVPVREPVPQWFSPPVLPLPSCWISWTVSNLPPSRSTWNCCKSRNHSRTLPGSCWHWQVSLLPSYPTAVSALYSQEMDSCNFWISTQGFFTK